MGKYFIIHLHSNFHYYNTGVQIYLFTSYTFTPTIFGGMLFKNIVGTNGICDSPLQMTMLSRTNSCTVKRDIGTSVTLMMIQ